jgi:PPM family protein phosphatase
MGEYEMAFLTAYSTDVGIRKQTNQDALLLKTAKTPKGLVGLFVICDGMGGLSHGELASATVIRGLSDWFENRLPELIDLEMADLDSIIPKELEAFVKEANEKIRTFAADSKVTMGTTLTVLLTIDTTYYIAHVGDSRVYYIHNGLTKLTKDQTLAMREFERGNITAEQAKVDKRRNVLLQCVGATEELEIAFSKGELETGAVYMLCSDGFYHEVSENELLTKLHPANFQNATQMKERAVELINLVKERKEPDNISVLLVKVV